MGQAAPIIMAISAAVAAGTAVYSASEQSKAADEAKKLANKNAAAAEAEAEEAARRARKDADRVEATARARAAGSGVEGETTDLYLKELETVNAEQIAWIKKSGASHADIARTQGKHAYRQGMAGAWGSMGTAAGHVGNVGTYGGQAGWWSS